MSQGDILDALVAMSGVRPAKHLIWSRSAPSGVWSRRFASIRRKTGLSWGSFVHAIFLREQGWLTG